VDTYQGSDDEIEASSEVIDESGLDVIMEWELYSAVLAVAAISCSMSQWHLFPQR
jgi:hypothetical protein